jgi:spore coat polysaccharide biosynthesis protein SpsF
MKKKIVAIVEARLNSKRLPNKVLKKIRGKEILKIILERLKYSKKIDTIVVAITKNKKDNKLENFLKKNKYNFYRGSEKNIINRIIRAGDEYNADIIIRLTGDNPLVDPKMIDYMLNFYLKDRNTDYLTNNNFGGLKKRKIAMGLDVSIFKLNKLKIVEKLIKNLKGKKIFREYPTLYFYTLGKKNFKIKNIKLPQKFILDKKYRLTVDTIEDFKFFSKLFFYLKNEKKYLSITKIKKVLLKYPLLYKINNKVTQYKPKFR